MVLSRLEEWPLKRLVREGYALTGLTSARPAGHMLSRDLIRFTFRHVAQPQHMTQHSFDVGDEAILSRAGGDGPIDADGNLHRNAVPCEVSELSANGLTVALDTSISASLFVRDATAVWRLDRGVNTTAYRRTSAALAEWTADDFNGAMALRRLLMEASKRAATDNDAEEDGYDAVQGATRHRIDGTDAAITCAAGMELNGPQQQAIIDSLKALEASHLHRGKASAHLIQGPPGTGKSTAAAALLKLAAEASPSGPLLATAESNAGVDALLEKLLAQGVRASRIGRPSRHEEHLFAATVESKLATHPSHEELQEEREQLRSLRTVASDLIGEERRQADQMLREGWRRVRRKEEELVREILQQSEVVCATLVGCGSPAVVGMRFPLVVIDEATQATEPRSLIALARANSTVVFVGDQKQLGPTVLSREAAERGLHVSTFERLVPHAHRGARGSLHHSLLTIQYRMHPELRAFPSKTWYNDELRDGIEAVDRSPPHSFPSPPGAGSSKGQGAADGGGGGGSDTGAGGREGSRDGSGGGSIGGARSPLAFYNAAGREQSDRQGTSKLNRREASAVATVALAMLKDVLPSDLGVITPYAAQAAEIRRALRQSGVYDVEVRTVDGFQGREKDVILFSAVRANKRGAVGFLADERRLNVGLTRARRALLVVGCRATLSADPIWRALIAHCDANGLVLTDADLAAHGVELPRAGETELARRAGGPNRKRASSTTPDSESDTSPSRSATSIQ